MRVPRKSATATGPSRHWLAGIAASGLGILTMIALVPPASAAASSQVASSSKNVTILDRSDCERGKNGFVDIPNNQTGTVISVANEWAGTRITLETTRRGRGVYGYAKISGGSPSPRDAVWLDVSNNGGNDWIQCGPFAAFPNNPVTSAAYPTSRSASRKFRACGVIYVFAITCTPWW